MTNINYVEERFSKITIIANIISIIVAIIVALIFENKNYIGISMGVAAVVIAFICGTAASIQAKEYLGIGIALWFYGMLAQVGVLCCLLLVAMFIAPFFSI